MPACLSVTRVEADIVAVKKTDGGAGAAAECRDETAPTSARRRGPRRGEWSWDVLVETGGDATGALSSSGDPMEGAMEGEVDPLASGRRSRDAVGAPGDGGCEMGLCAAQSTGAATTRSRP